MHQGNNKVLFSEAVCSISCEGGTIVEYNCNYAIINCFEAKEVIVKGYKYIDNLQTHLVEIENLGANQKQNILKIESAYLINKTNAVSIANRILNFYQKKYNTSLRVLLKDEILSENVEIENDFNKNLVGNITKLDIDLTRRILGKC